MTVFFVLLATFAMVAIAAIVISIEEFPDIDSPVHDYESIRDEHEDSSI